MNFIQMSPSHDVEMQTADERSRGSSATVTAQIWQRSGSCPKGTIPVRRMHKSHAYGRKKPVFLHHNAMFNDSKEVYLMRKNYSVSEHEIPAILVLHF